MDHTTSGYCTPPRLGYKIDSSVAQVLYVFFLLLCRFTTLGAHSTNRARSQIDDLTNALDNALTIPLVMHPIFCAFAFLVMICAIAVAFRQTRGLGICTLLLAGFTLVLTTILFIIDVCLVAITKSRVQHLSDNLHVGWGAIPWMTLAAAVCLMFGSITLFMSFMRSRRSRSVSLLFPRLAVSDQ